MCSPTPPYNIRDQLKEDHETVRAGNEVAVGHLMAALCCYGTRLKCPGRAGDHAVCALPTADPGNS